EDRGPHGVRAVAVGVLYGRDVPVEADPAVEASVVVLDSREPVRVVGVVQGGGQDGAGVGFDHVAGGEGVRVQQRLGGAGQGGRQVGAHASPRRWRCSNSNRIDFNAASKSAVVANA